jgi:hypothetical protein
MSTWNPGNLNPARILQLASTPEGPLPFRWLLLGRWASLVILLSLDAARPWWVPMGLGRAVPARDGWIRALRRALAEASEAARDPGEARLSLGSRALAAVTADLGAEAGRLLLRFGRFVFARGPSDHPELFAWQAVLDACGDDPARWGALDLPVEARSALALAAQRAKALSPDLAPLSASDRETLAASGTRAAGTGSPEHAAQLVAWTSRVVEARAAWCRAAPHLDEDRRERAILGATRLGRSLGVVPSGAVLPDPEVLFLEVGNDA